MSNQATRYNKSIKAQAEAVTNREHWYDTLEFSNCTVVRDKSIKEIDSLLLEHGFNLSDKE